MRPVIKVALVVLILFVGLTAYLFMKCLNAIDAAVAHHPVAHHDDTAMAEMIQAACLSYLTQYNRLPPSSDNQKLTAALLGDNSLHIVFLSFSKNQLNSNNEMIDQWGTPFHINFQLASGIQVISAGPDQRFNTPDDIVINSPVNQSTH